VSTELAKKLDELGDRARQAESAAEFEEAVARSQKLAKAAAQLTDVLAVDGLPELWPYLQRIMVDSVSEPHLMRLLRSECRQLVAARPEQVIAVLGDLVRDSVSKTLEANEVWQHIRSQGWRRAELGRDEGTLAAIDKQNGRFRRRLDDLTIGDRFFPSPEADTVLKMLLDPEGPKAVLVTGHGGAGKSGVIRAVFDHLTEEGWPLVALRADWLPPARTSAQLVADIGIPASPAIVLTAPRSSRQRLLILDQLDAVSTASGRRTGLLVALEELFQELADVDGVRILMACREFDLQSDRGPWAGDVQAAGDAAPPDAVRRGGRSTVRDGLSSRVCRGPLRCVLGIQATAGRGGAGSAVSMVGGAGGGLGRNRPGARPVGT
jgi:hypothetical protein